MPTTIDTTGLDRLRARFARIVNPDPRPVLETWQDIMDEDNRRGVLAGLDGQGNPLMPVTYRPVDTKGKKVAKGAKLTIEQRLGQGRRTKRGRFAAFGSSSEGSYNNLSSSSYRKLDGPPLAPRRQFSRVITNYMQRDGQVRYGVWEVVGAWIDVVSQTGVPFLHWHFDGTSKLPRRDLRGIRPWGLDKARKAARAWMIDQIRSND